MDSALSFRTLLFKLRPGVLINIAATSAEVAEAMPNALAFMWFESECAAARREGREPSGWLTLREAAAIMPGGTQPQLWLRALPGFRCILQHENALTLVLQPCSELAARQQPPLRLGGGSVWPPDAICLAAPGAVRFVTFY